MFEPLPQDKCCGCMACVDACAKGALGVVRDEMGFPCPALIRAERCVSCGRCNLVCPGREARTVQRNVGEVLCAYSRDDERRSRASSGGIFGELASVVLKQGGAVTGAAFDGQFLVNNIVIESEEELNRISGSKYLQSNAQGVYRATRRLLQAGRTVLFSGTPCQAAALERYLGEAYDKLYVVDLFCYGVPAPAVWQEWLSHISAGKMPVRVNFRDKTEGWDNYSLKVEFLDGSVYRKNKQEDGFLKTFTKGGYIRSSCLECAYKGFPRSSDLSLGDFQELRELFPEKDGFKGVSMIRINSEKGRALLASCAENIEMETVDARTMDECHPGIGFPAVRNQQREKLIAAFGHMPVDQLLRRYGGLPARQRLRMKAMDMLRRLGLYEQLRRLKNRR